MQRERYLRMYDLHSWSGIALGLVIFIISFSGCLALFHNELQSWEDPAKRLPFDGTPTPIHNTLVNWLDEHRQANEQVSFVGFNYPTPQKPYYLASAYIQQAQGGQRNVVARWGAESGELIAAKSSGMSHWLYDFHRELMWPRALGGATVGRALVGAVGIMLFISIVSGILIHKKIIRELFTLRLQRQVRLKWQDAHKLIGTWGLPFFLMVAFTGAYLGIMTILTPIMGVVVMQGDTAKLTEVIGSGQIDASGTPASMYSVDAALHHRHPDGGQQPQSIFIHNWGDENAIYQMAYAADTEILTLELLPLSGVDARLVPGNRFDEPSVVNRVFGAIEPLHYATYGGAALKLVYLALGLLLCVITALGNVMWLERRHHGREGHRSPAFYRRLGQLSIGVCYGIVIASIGLFYFDKLYPGGENTRLLGTGLCYFLLWFAVIAVAFLKQNAYHSNRFFFRIIATLLLGLPWLNGFATGDFFWQMLNDSAHSTYAWVDLVLLVCGCIALLVSFSLPKERAQWRAERQEQSAKPVDQQATESIVDTPLNA
jgi:uncharacterized iron-regulated membrane protein